jgi:hypothetical protein
MDIREAHEEPDAIGQWGWKYHHLGIPTNQVMPGEVYLPDFKLYVSGFDTNPFGIEWMRYEKESPVDQLIQKVPHLAFEVSDLDKELADHDLKILTPPNSPTSGIRVAMIEHNGAPVELIEFEKNKKRWKN